MTRFVDRGAITAAWVGLGMAVTIGVSFLLVIPIHAINFFLSPFAGMLIGYYANTRSERAGGPWKRIIANALFAGAVTGVTFALLFIAVKGLFFALDDGYRDPSLGGRITCATGADCVYQRSLKESPEELAAAGVTDLESFATFHWEGIFQVSGTMLLMSVGGALFGGVMYGFTNRRKPEDQVATVA